MSEVLEQDVDRLDVGTLELLPSQRGPMHSRELVDLLTDDDAEVLEVQASFPNAGPGDVAGVVWAIKSGDARSLV